jgi:hypothetical protein
LPRTAQRRLGRPASPLCNTALNPRWIAADTGFMPDHAMAERPLRRGSRARAPRGRLASISCLAAVAAAFAAVPAWAGTVLSGAPVSVVRLAASGKMPQPPAVYDFHWASDCGTRGALGCTSTLDQVTLDPMLLRMSSANVATGLGKGVPLMSFVLFHELGHVFDREWMTDAARTRFTGLIGRTGDWWSAADGPPPAELFADAYALCSIYGARIPHDLRHPVGYGWKPSVALDAASCAIVLGVASAKVAVPILQSR